MGKGKKKRSSKKLATPKVVLASETNCISLEFPLAMLPVKPEPSPLVPPPPEDSHTFLELSNGSLIYTFKVPEEKALDKKSVRSLVELGTSNSHFQRWLKMNKLPGAPSPNLAVHAVSLHDKTLDMSWKCEDVGLVKNTKLKVERVATAGLGGEEEEGKAVVEEEGNAAEEEGRAASLPARAPAPVQAAATPPPAPTPKAFPPFKHVVAIRDRSSPVNTPLTPSRGSVDRIVNGSTLSDLNLARRVKLWSMLDEINPVSAENQNVGGDPNAHKKHTRGISPQDDSSGSSSSSLSSNSLFMSRLKDFLGRDEDLYGKGYGDYLRAHIKTIRDDIKDGKVHLPNSSSSSSTYLLSDIVTYDVLVKILATWEKDEKTRKMNAFDVSPPRRAGASFFSEGEVRRRRGLEQSDSNASKIQNATSNIPQY